MQFALLDKKQILNTGLKTADCSVLYKVGSLLNVVCLKNSNKNKALSETLAIESKSDKLMCSYKPCNEICFDEEFLLSENDNCSMEISDGIVRVEKPEIYSEKRGILLFSGIISANGVVENQNYLKGSNLFSDVEVLSVGGRNNGLFGLFHIRDNSDCVLTKKGDGITLESWFDGVTLVGEVA